MSVISLTYLTQFRTNTPAATSDTAAEPYPDTVEAAAVYRLLIEKLQDGLDHPEIWSAWPSFLAGFPALATLVEQHWLVAQPGEASALTPTTAHALCIGYSQGPAFGVAVMQPLIKSHPQSPLVQGVLSFLQKMACVRAHPSLAAQTTR